MNKNSEKKNNRKTEKKKKKKQTYRGRIIKKQKYSGTKCSFNSHLKEQNITV